jgi:uncharacterized Fe-S cluster-containing MiaB family protein
MGATLKKIYFAIKSEGGMRAQMRLALMTGLPSQMAAEAEETEELIQKFRKSYQEIMSKEYPLAGEQRSVL